MPIIARDTRKPFTPAPEGVHQAVCVDVVDRGRIQTKYGEQHKVDLRFELNLLSPDGNGTRRFLVQQRYTLSLNEKANLSVDLETWRGRRFTQAEREGFDLETLVGVNCQASIVHNVGTDGRVFANINAIVPLGKGMAKMSPSREYVRARDRPDNAGAATDTEADRPQDDPMDGESAAASRMVPTLREELTRAVSAIERMRRRVARR